MPSSLARLTAAAPGRDDRTLLAVMQTGLKAVRVLASVEAHRQGTGPERVISTAVVLMTEAARSKIWTEAVPPGTIAAADRRAAKACPAQVVAAVAAVVAAAVVAAEEDNRGWTTIKIK
jgi:Flp pilus assembly protein CpaB